MPPILTWKGVSMKYAEFKKIKNWRDIIESLKIITRIPIDRTRFDERKTYLYYLYKDRIMIARFAGMEIFDKVKNCLKEPISIDIPEYNMKLKPHQEIIHDYLMENIYTPERIQKGTAGCVATLGTGQGKTFLAMSFIDIFKVKTLIIVPGEPLLIQWRDILTEIFPQNKIGVFYGKKKQDGDIILMVANSALNSKFFNLTPFEYFTQFGFIVFDEIHKYPTPKIGGIFWRTCAPRVLGLTASPNSRRDEFDRVYFEHVGEWVECSKIPGFSFKGIQFTVEVHSIEYEGPPEYTKKLCGKGSTTTNVPLMVKQFMADPYRTSMIVNLIEYLFKSGRCIYIVSERRDHLVEIHNLLECRGLSADAPELISTVMGGTKEEKLKLTQEKANILLTTYGYGTEGISIDRMDTLLLISPRVSKMDQISGRIKRLGGDNSIVRRIYDIIDWNTTIKNQCYKRRASFRKDGYIVNSKNNIRINWRDDRCSPDKIFEGEFWFT